MIIRNHNIPFNTFAWIKGHKTLSVDNLIKKKGRAVYKLKHNKYRPRYAPVSLPMSCLLYEYFRLFGLGSKFALQKISLSILVTNFEWER